MRYGNLYNPLQEKIMKLHDLSLIIVGIVVVCLAVGLISSQFYGPDNEIEEAAEEVIKKEIGVDIDLSPSTKEANVRTSG